MSRRRGRRRGDAGSSAELSIYDLANKLPEVPNLPSKKLSKEEANNYLGLMCLLECKSPVGKHSFGKRFARTFSTTHI